MKISVSSICKQGGREYNQDYVACSVDGANACLVVCDGLGSYFGSEVASNLCASKITEAYEKAMETEPDKALKLDRVLAYLQKAHNYIAEYKDLNPKISSSCTTVACVITDSKSTVMCHIGDTRIHYFKKGVLTYLSKDHSMAQVAVDMGHITHNDIRNHKDQNKLTRVLGGEYYVAPTHYVHNQPLEDGDAFLLCTDGFWEYVYEDEMSQDIVSNGTPADILAKMEARLSKRVNKFNDNYSAILAIVTEK